ncbi:MAG: GNAT family N-acetyltransferase [Algicola sp.]|nr:GNAT family N-acetyltransferase [Algicola sp.]
MQWKKDNYLISTDKVLLDFELIYQFISTSYWAKGIPKETLQKALDGSLCFGLYHDGKQIGLSRMITDNATFAYLADVFVLEEYRGKGLSKWMMECVLAHPSLQGLRRIMLATADAHGLYEKYGFTAISMPEMLMQIHRPDAYNN